MNQPNLEQEIIQTLELCLSKMSEKLNQFYEPFDKLSNQLLQQFRFTITTYHTCQKRASKTPIQDQLTSQIKQNTPPIQTFPKQKNHHVSLKQRKQDIIDQEKVLARLIKQEKNKTHNPPATSSNPPSGLFYNPG